MRVIKPRTPEAEGEVTLGAAIENISAAFAGVQVLDPEESQRVIEAESFTVAMSERRDEEKLTEKYRVYDELREASQQLCDHRAALYEHFGKHISKRSYFVMQCQLCEMPFLGFSGAKGWQYPSSRSGQCSVCTAGMTVAAAKKVTAGAHIVEQVHPTSTQETSE